MAIIYFISQFLSPAQYASPWLFQTVALGKPSEPLKGTMCHLASTLTARENGMGNWKMVNQAHSDSEQLREQCYHSGTWNEKLYKAHNSNL